MKTFMLFDDDGNHIYSKQIEDMKKDEFLTALRKHWRNTHTTTDCLLTHSS